MSKYLSVLLSACCLFAAPRLAAQTNPAITINVNAATGHPIDSRIYGAAFADAEEIDQLGISVNRWGGNAMSRYNWAFSTANRAKDWYFYNIPDQVSSGDGSDGKSADDFIGLTLGANAEPILTIPLMSLLPKDRAKRCSYPGQTWHEAFGDSLNCGNGRLQDHDGIEGNGPRILGIPDPGNIHTSYTSLHQRNWIQHLVATWGSSSEGGVRYYSLDNEPSIWHADHWDVHPDGATYDEVWGKMADYGAAIKSVDPDARLTGPEEWGWSGYFASGRDQDKWGTAEHNADRLAHGNKAYIDWLVEQARDYENAHGIRILDVVTVHYYPQSGEFWSYSVDPSMQELRNRSTRSLWDPEYVDESWIGETGIDGGRVRLVPRLKEWAASHNPPLETGITEYNWGDIDHINLATTQADILGIFGREGLDIGVRWVAPPADSFTGSAFRMYRNYDGIKSTFGDVSVPVAVPNPDEVSAFAARRSYDDALTIMLIAKRLTGNTPATVNVANFVADGSVAQRWQLSSAAKTASRLPDVAFNGSVTLTLPPQTITLLVIPGVDVPELVAPSNFSATATGASSVTLAWSAVNGATGYELERSVDGGAFTPVVPVATPGHIDGGRVTNKTYLYRVRAKNGFGTSAWSAIDAATTIVFADDPLIAGVTPIRASHVTQLRTAVNAMRAAAGLPAADFGPAVVAGSSPVSASQIQQLRDHLNHARTTIGLSSSGYSDPLLAGVLVKALHVTELRDRVK